MNEAILSFYYVFKAVIIVVDVLLLAFFVFLFAKSWKYKPEFHIARKESATYTLRTAVLQEHWDAIIERSKIDSPETIKFSIVDADNLVNELLERMNVNGDRIFASKEKKGSTIADKLENLSPDDFKTLNRLWAAHRVRNRIVHEPDFTISQEEAWKVLDDYGAFLKEIEAIK